MSNVVASQRLVQGDNFEGVVSTGLQEVLGNEVTKFYS